ncbi:helix-turn-helix domain-containing protein [bacterium]|nr:helix-turn-helix domain-containing protein [bacterium]
MKVEIVKPSKDLASIVKSYSIIESEQAMETTVLPHLGLVLAVQFKGNITLNCKRYNDDIAGLTVSGMRKSFRRFCYEQNSGIILISFTETGAAQVFGPSVFDLYDIARPLEQLLVKSSVEKLQESIIIAASSQRRIELIENFLRSNIIEYRPDKLVEASVAQIEASVGLLRIKNLASQFSLSQDAFEKRFRKIVGTTPKQFSKIVRMKAIIAKQKPEDSFAELAYDFGFYDQSHFNREFRYFTGQNPRNFFMRPYQW